MRIAYIAPLERGLSRMKHALFTPFDLGKWFTLGFTVFLAEIINSHNGGGGGGSSSARERIHVGLDDIRDIPEAVFNWFADNPIWFAACLFGLIALIAIVLILTWLSSRGKFMFLYNVATEDAKVSKPWREYGREADSLFLWRVVFGLISLVPTVLLIGFGLRIAFEIWDGYYPTALMIIGLISLGLIALVFFIAIAYIDLFLNAFVVPIMYRERLPATGAWQRFLALFSRHPWHFILYGLVVFFLHLMVSVCLFVVGLFTCCFGLLILAIPYIGSVITLPISYTYRAFSLEYLEQFGPEYKIFAPTTEGA